MPPPTNISLPVLTLDADRRAGTRMGRRRAIVLVVVHLLLVAHVVQYLMTGSTLSPLEPSEATYSLRDGAINAGAVFLVVTVLSTLVFGRFFCGWACHLVAYQDACRWLLIKVGLRPKPVRARLLMLVPLFAVYWLYGRPILDRLEADATPTGVTWQLTTDAFWATFPGPTISVLTLLICGFVIVYVLGAKGFCAYACPYGALFGIADRAARGRIRVNEDCDQIGDCTRTCSSNVDVAREVAQFGMVINPGCMKCLDCVSGCPNDALSFSFTRVTAPVARAPKPRSGAAPRPAWPGIVCYITTFGAMLVVVWNPLYQVREGGLAILIAALAAAPLADLLRPPVARGPLVEARFLIGAAGAFALAMCAPPGGTIAPAVGVPLAAGLAGLLRLVLVRRRGAGPDAGPGQGAAPEPDLTWAEELLLIVLFAALFWVTYRLFRIVPFLMSLGVAAVGAALLLVAARLLYRRDVRFQSVGLRRGGRITRAGAGYATCAVLVTGVAVHAGFVQWNTKRAVEVFDVARAARVDGHHETSRSASASAQSYIDRAERLAPVAIRGAGRMAGELARWRGDFAAAIARYDAELAAAGHSPALPMYRGLALLAQGDLASGRAAVERALEGKPPRERFLELDWELRQLLGAGADPIAAEALLRLRFHALRRAHAVHPDDAAFALALAKLLERPPLPALRDRAEALAVAERTAGLTAGPAVAGDGSNHDLLGLLAWLYAEEGRWTDAVRAADASAAAARAHGREDIAGQMEAMAEDYRRRAGR